MNTMEDVYDEYFLMINFNIIPPLASFYEV